MKVVVIFRLGNMKARDKMMPLLMARCVQHVTLVRHQPVAIESDKLTQVIHDIGIDGASLRQGALLSLKNVWFSFWRALRSARRERPDAIIGINFVPYGVIAWLVARLSGRPVVVSLMGTDFNLRIKTPLFGSIMRAILRNCDRVAIFGEAGRRELIGYGLSEARVFVLPNTVDTHRFRPDSTVTPTVDLIYTGYLRPRKRVDLVLHTLREIHKTRPETTMLIVGDGPERRKLEALAHSLGVAEQATFYGWSDAVVEQLRAARVFVSLSEVEGLPVALLEAMCAGLPPVVTAVNAVDSVVKHDENGYLVPSPASPEAAAGYVLRLLEDSAHYRTLREQTLKVRETHGYEHMARRWEEILRGMR